MGDLHNLIPFGVWLVTQVLKWGLPALERTAIGKGIWPFLSVILGVIGGAFVNNELVNVAFPSVMQALTDAGYGLMATGAHEVGTAVGKVVKTTV